MHASAQIIEKIDARDEAQEFLILDDDGDHAALE